MNNVSSQEFRNAYENFYIEMRKYLWPYKVLEELADVEVSIYSAFVDIETLRRDFNRLLSSIKDEYKEDEKLAKVADKISNLIDTAEPSFYFNLFQVRETNPQTAKQLNYKEETKEEDTL